MLALSTIRATLTVDAVNRAVEAHAAAAADSAEKTVEANVADKYDQALANARTQLDTERMQEQAGLNQYLYGNEIARNQDLSNRAMNLLGQRVGMEQTNAATNQNLLGQRAQRDLYESTIPLQYGQAALGAATGLTQSQNDILSNQWNQSFQESQFNAQKQLEAWKQEEQQRAARNEELMNIFGQVNLSDEEERQLINSIMGDTPFLPTPADGTRDGVSSPWIDQFARDQYRAETGPGVFQLPSNRVDYTGFGGEGPPFPGGYIGERINTSAGTFVWTGSAWNKQ